MSGFLAPILLSLAPLLAATSMADPAGDTASCRGGVAVPDPAIDLIRGEAVATEGGSAVRFTITFSHPVPWRDTERRPLRVDVLVRDPQVPASSFAYYRGVNRIVRFDAVGGAGIAVLLLPERGTNTFLGASVDGTVLTMELPGRLLTRDLDLRGPAVDHLHWSVVARDGGSCDFLGGGRPTLAVARAAPLAQASPSPPSSDDPKDPPGWVPALAVFGTIAALWIYASVVRRRAMRR